MSRIAFVLFTAALALAAVSSPARADDAAAERVLDRVFDRGTARLLAQIGKRSLRRARRGITLGPFAGVAPSYAIDGGDLDVQLAFGIAVYRYDLPVVPTPERIKEILLGKARALYTERIQAAVLRGESLADADYERIAQETWEDIKAEFLLETRPKRFEKPGFAALVEVTHLLDAGAWDVRGMVGLGVGPAYLKAGMSAQWNDGAALIIPIELSVPALLSDSLRSPVVDVFVRYEVAATGRDGHPDLALVGARLALDIL